MIVTHYAAVPIGTHPAGSLFEFKGFNLNRLPNDLTATSQETWIDTTDQRHIWDFAGASPDGTTGYFRSRVEYTTNNIRTLQFFATPKDPPRTLYTDYTYQPE